MSKTDDKLESCADPDNFESGTNDIKYKDDREETKLFLNTRRMSAPSKSTPEINISCIYFANQTH